MARLKFTTTEEITGALQAEADKRGIAMSELIRRYILAGLKADGYTIEDAAVHWGGGRKPQTSDE